MFWRRSRREDSDPPEAEDSSAAISSEPADPGPMVLERNAPRPPAILQVAEHYEQRGARIVELFKEVQSPQGQTVLPIHLDQDGSERFVEVETGPWSDEAVDAALRAVAVLRGSEYADAEVEILSAYPVPSDVMFFYSHAPAALFQLALMNGDVERPEEFADMFRATAAEQWDIDLNYEVGGLSLVEELLLSALNEEPQSDEDASEEAPVLRELVDGLGCYVGEVIRRNAPGDSGSWRPATEWGEDAAVLEMGSFELDPIGKARAFLLEGPEDSVAFYAEFVLEELSNTDAEGPENA